MGFRFRKSFKIAPGVRVNVGKKSVGISAGVKGARVSVNSKGRVTKTVGIPGTGLTPQHLVKARLRRVLRSSLPFHRSRFSR